MYFLKWCNVVTPARDTVCAGAGKILYRLGKFMHNAVESELWVAAERRSCIIKGAGKRGYKFIQLIICIQFFLPLSLAVCKTAVRCIRGCCSRNDRHIYLYWQFLFYSLGGKIFSCRCLRLCLLMRKVRSMQTYIHRFCIKYYDADLNKIIL